MDFLGIAGRHGYDEVVSLHLITVLSDHGAASLCLHYVLHVKVELYVSSLALYLLAQIDTHVLRSKLGLLLLQSVLNIIQNLRLIDVVKSIEKTNLAELHAKKASNTCLNHNL